MQTTAINVTPSAETSTLLPKMVHGHGISYPAAQSSGALEGKQPDPTPELDTMLSGEPGLGAFAGLRVALLFNAGIALSGLLIWEIWTMLAS
jgi:hypothetical protein